MQLLLMFLKKIQTINLKEKFDLPENSIIGIAGGRFSSEKGQCYLVEAAKIAIQKNENLKFILFGDGPDFQKIQSQINKLNLQSSVLCPGYEKNMIGCLKDADFFDQPLFIGRTTEYRLRSNGNDDSMCCNRCRRSK